MEQCLFKRLLSTLPSKFSSYIAQEEMVMVGSKACSKQMPISKPYRNILYNGM